MLLKCSKSQNRFDSVIPQYSWPWLIGIVVLNLLVYFGTRLIPRFIPFTDCTLPLDAFIPFVPEMIVIYILSYVFWIENYIIIVSESHENCKFVLTGEIFAKLICLLCFILVPTQITRPDPEGSGIFVSLTRLIYALDEPNNLLPSIHVLESWFCWRGLRDCNRVSGFYKVFSLIFFIAVCISTVTVRQHVLVDIPAGIIAGELGLALSGLINKKKAELTLTRKTLCAIAFLLRIAQTV